MFATEVGSKEMDTNRTDITVSHELLAKLQIIDTSESSATGADLDEGNVNKSVVNRKVEADIDDNVRVESPSKSVRFVEGNERQTSDLSQNSKEMKQIVNENIAKQQNQDSGNETSTDIKTDSKNKKNKKGTTCKDEKIEEIFKKDEDDDDSGGRNNERNSQQEKNSDNRQSGSANRNNNYKVGNEEKGQQGSGDSKHKKSRHNQQPRERSGSITRTGSASSGKKESRNAKGKKIKGMSSDRSSSRPSSAKGGCSRFEKSEASKQHTNTLEVSSVIHGNSVATTVGPESPKRSRSRSASPSRKGLHTQTNAFSFLGIANEPCFGSDDYFDMIYGRGDKTKVKFMIEGEEPEMETIFIEDDNDVTIKPDREINFDILDSELAMLRADIRTTLNETTTANGYDLEQGKTENMDSLNNDQDTESLLFDGVESETDNDSDSEIVNETEVVDTMRDDYSNLLEKYRQRCMQRSEAYGVISSTLVTPRETQSLVSSKSVSRRIPSTPDVDKDKTTAAKDPTTIEKKTAQKVTVLSDSGHGSVENLSELSRSASVTLTPVPRLDLGDCTSDLGLDTARSDKTITKDSPAKVEDDLEQKNLLEMVCEQLSPIEKVGILNLIFIFINTSVAELPFFQNLHIL